MAPVRGAWMIVGLVTALTACLTPPTALALGAAELLEATKPTQWRRGSRSRQSLQKLPPEYRRIPARSAITRAELAAVLSVQLDGLLEQTGQGQVVILTDTRDHWADRWMQTAVRAGIMEPSPTHQFEPDRLLQRRELAEAIAAIFDLAADDRPSLTWLWHTREPVFADMPPTHICYQAAVAVVSAGVLDVELGGFFRPTAFVSGKEVSEAVRRLERLVRR